MSCYPDAISHTSAQDEPFGRHLLRRLPPDVDLTLQHWHDAPDKDPQASERLAALKMLVDRLPTHSAAGLALQAPSKRLRSLVLRDFDLSYDEFRLVQEYASQGRSIDWSGDSIAHILRIKALPDRQFVGAMRTLNQRVKEALAQAKGAAVRAGAASGAFVTSEGKVGGAFQGAMVGALVSG